MTLKERNPASSTLLYQSCHGQACGILDCVLAKIIRREWHSPYAVLMSGYSSNSIAALCFCLSVHFSADLKQEITRAYKQFLAGVSIGIAVRDILLTVLSGFLHLIVSLLHGIPTVFDAQLLYGITSQFLDMEAVDGPAGFRNAVRTILRMESDKSSVTSSTALRCSSSIRCRTAITSSAFVPATTGNQGLLPRAGPHGWLQTCTAHHWIARIRR